MPAAWVRDEDKWEKAKALAREQYKDVADGTDRFWSIVTAIYKKMGGRITKALLARCPGCRAPIARINEEGDMVLKSRYLVARVDGGVAFRCTRCHAQHPLPADVVEALAPRTRLVARGTP